MADLPNTQTDEPRRSAISARWHRLSIKQKQVVWAWAFLAIPILFYSVVRFYPTGNAFVLSFQEWNLLGMNQDSKDI